MEMYIHRLKNNKKFNLNFELLKNTGSKKNFTNSCLMWECKKLPSFLKEVGVDKICYKKYGKMQKSL